MAAAELGGGPGQVSRDVPDIARRIALVGLDADDLARIRGIREIVVRQADQITDAFFDFLSGFGEAAALFADTLMLREARRLKREHLLAMVGAVYDDSYAEQRIRLARLYGKAGIDTTVFLGAFQRLMRDIGDAVMRDAGTDLAAGFAAYASLAKVGALDVGLIVDGLIGERENTIRLQQEAIRELATPVLRLRERLLILPLIGLIDSQRALQITDNLLRAIRDDRARVVVMDVTGVAAVDSKVANHLLQTVAAARLMGAQVIVTGVSADVAQALVALGVDLGSVRTLGDLQGGLEEAERLLGYRVVPSSDAGVPPSS